MSSPQKKYWFPAKRYGWGWSFPTCWQGWLVFAGYFGLLALGVVLLRDEEEAKFIFFASALTLTLLMTCWKFKALTPPTAARSVLSPGRAPVRGTCL